MEAVIELLEEEAKKEIKNKGQTHEILRDYTAGIRTKNEEERAALTVTDEEVIEYLKTRYDVHEKEKEAESPEQAWTEWTMTDRGNFLRKYGFKTSFAPYKFNELDKVMQDRVAYSLKTSSINDLFSDVKTNEKPLKFMATPLTPESSYDTVYKVVGDILDYTKSLKMDSTGIYSDELNERRNKLTDGLITAGYETGQDLTEVIKDTYGELPEWALNNRSKRSAKSPRDSFIFEKDSFQFDAKKGKIIKSFYEEVGETADFKVLIKEAKEKRDELEEKQKNKTESIRKIYENELERDKMLREQGQYFVDKQVEKFAKTNILLVKK